MPWAAGKSVRLAMLLSVLIVQGYTAPAIGQAAFPARLDSYFTKVLKLTGEERSTLLAGRPLAKSLDADPSKEVALFGAIWISAPSARYVAAIRDIENFEKGPGFLATKKISEPARAEDFAQLRLPDED